MKEKLNSGSDNEKTEIKTKVGYTQLAIQPITKYFCPGYWN